MPFIDSATPEPWRPFRKRLPVVDSQAGPVRPPAGPDDERPDAVTQPPAADTDTQGDQ